MKLILRTILAISFLIMIVCIVLLLNFTAPNPTGRRYSSQMPVTTGQGDSQQIGLSAELILANDLRLPRNEDEDQRQCACSDNSNFTPSANQCRVCFAYSPSVTTYRIPDFIGKNFIAESKNRQNLLYKYADQVEQISDYAVIAKQLGQPLFVYIRVDTDIRDEFADIVETTGGGIIPYFTVSGYVDPVDSAAKSVFITSTSVFGLALLLGRVGSRRKYRIVRASSPKSPRTPKLPDDTLSKVVRKTETAEEFARRSKEKERQKIDIEDSRDER